MATATRLTMEEYLSSHYEPECELIDGELKQKPMGTTEHMLVAKRIVYALKKYEDAGVGEGLQEASIRISKESVLIPDVVFVRNPVKPGILETPPLLCVEILLPSDRFSETLAKMDRYFSFGVEACWIVDPVKKIAWWMGKDGIPHEERETLRGGELEVSVSDFFR